MLRRDWRPSSVSLTGSPPRCPVRSNSEHVSYLPLRAGRVCLFPSIAPKYSLLSSWLFFYSETRYSRLIHDTALDFHSEAGEPCCVMCHKDSEPLCCAYCLFSGALGGLERLSGCNTVAELAPGHGRVSPASIQPLVLLPYFSWLLLTRSPELVWGGRPSWGEQR